MNAIRRRARPLPVSPQLANQEKKRSVSDRPSVAGALISSSHRPKLPVAEEGGPAPTFSHDLEREIGASLEERLGRGPTADELVAYREILWAFASTLRGILSRNPIEQPFPYSQWREQPSTSESRASPTTDNA